MVTLKKQNKQKKMNVSRKKRYSGGDLFKNDDYVIVIATKKNAKILNYNEEKKVYNIEYLEDETTDEVAHSEIKLKSFKPIMVEFSFEKNDIVSESEIRSLYKFNDKSLYFIKELPLEKMKNHVFKTAYELQSGLKNENMKNVKPNRDYSIKNIKYLVNNLFNSEQKEIKKGKDEYYISSIEILETKKDQKRIAQFKTPMRVFKVTLTTYLINKSVFSFKPANYIYGTFKNFCKKRKILLNKHGNALYKKEDKKIELDMPTRSYYTRNNYYRDKYDKNRKFPQHNRLTYNRYPSFSNRELDEIDYLISKNMKKYNLSEEERNNLIKSIDALHKKNPTNIKKSDIDKIKEKIKKNKELNIADKTIITSLY